MVQRTLTFANLATMVWLTKDGGSYTIYNGQLSCTACSPFMCSEGSPVTCFVDVMQISARIIPVLISVLFIKAMGPEAYCSHKGLPVGTCCEVEDISQQDSCGDRMHPVHHHTPQSHAPPPFLQRAAASGHLQGNQR